MNECEIAHFCGNWFKHHPREQKPHNVCRIKHRLWLLIVIARLWIVYLICTLNYVNVNLWVDFWTISPMKSYSKETKKKYYAPLTNRQNETTNQLLKYNTNLGRYCWLTVSCKCIWWIMHHASVVICNAISSCCCGALFIEICLCSFGALITRIKKNKQFVECLRLQ